MAALFSCLIFLLIMARWASCVSNYSEIKQNAHLTSTEFIKKYGYPVEKHPVITQDGYILELHRIPFSPMIGGKRKRGPVLLQHGMLDSSAGFLIMGPKKSLGFILADLGYDVWLGNSRGNRYSRKHTALNPDKNKQFWDFSWDEMGMYDTPAAIDYILETTGHPKLFYIGHSQGTTQFYVMASERPEYNDKIRAMFSLAPVAFMSNAKYPLLALSKKLSSTSVVSALIGNRFRELLPHSKATTELGLMCCADGRPTQFLCTRYLGLFLGFDVYQMNRTTIPVILGHTPAGISTKQIMHYAQESVSGKFRRFDYGRTENLQRYGRETPPDYNLTQMSAPISLHFAINDWLADPKDVVLLYNQLTNPIGRFLVPHEKFRHLEFLYAIDVKKLLYNQIIALMEKY